MSEVDVTPRSRRAILGAALGGVAASIAAAIGRPAGANAADGNPVLLGVGNEATQTTTIESTDGPAMQVTGGSLGLQGTGQSGLSGQGTAAGGVGVGGYALAASGTGRGVYGVTNSPDGVGVLGISNQGSTGVHGYSFSGSGDLQGHPDKVGVFGYAAQDGTARGVKGQTTGGTGVEGVATTGTGVRASSASGTALAVSGRATFNRSGTASIPAGQKYVDITPPGGLAPTAFVVATLQTYRSGAWVMAARKNYPSAGKVRIVLNKVASTSASTPVGWIVIN